MSILDQYIQKKAELKSLEDSIVQWAMQKAQRKEHVHEGWHVYRDFANRTVTFTYSQDNHGHVRNFEVVVDLTELFSPEDARFIILNGRQTAVRGDDLDYYYLIELRTRRPRYPEIYTVTWKSGTGGGTLRPGGSIPYEEGLIINITLTNNA